MMKTRFLRGMITGVLFLSFMFLMTDRGYGIEFPLPKLFLPKPPLVAVIPGTYVYVVPDIKTDLVFFQDFWYRPHKGKWYRATHYNGPWRRVRAVPPALLGLPHGFRNVPRRHERIPFFKVKRNWKKWEREKHWGNKEVFKKKRRGRRH